MSGSPIKLDRKTSTSRGYSSSNLKSSSKSKTQNEVKCVIVGDGAVGKTCLLWTYIKGAFPQEYIPTVFDNYDHIIDIEGKEPILMHLWDTAGQEAYARLRALSYVDSDIFIICFAVDDTTSFEHVKILWAPEIFHHCPTAAVVLVGCKSDLRQNPSFQASFQGPWVTKEDGVNLAKELKYSTYIECSALNSKGICEVFEEAALIGLKKQILRKKKGRNISRKCLIL